MKINGTTPCYFCGSKNKNGTILNPTFLNDDSKIEDERKNSNNSFIMPDKTPCGVNPENYFSIEDTYLTGADECDAYSKQYSCGCIYNHNYMDVVGNRDHDCFYDCSKCKYNYHLSKMEKEKLLLDKKQKR